MSLYDLGNSFLTFNSIILFLSLSEAQNIPQKCIGKCSSITFVNLYKKKNSGDSLKQHV